MIIDTDEEFVQLLAQIWADKSPNDIQAILGVDQETAIQIAAHLTAALIPIILRQRQENL